MLTNYIRDLLYRYECVVIPDFGSIQTKSVSARIDEESHSFFPPSKSLSFDAENIETDGLLADYIATSDNISNESAVNYIKFEVNEWLEKLKRQDLELENIGVFSLNSDGKIIFDPDPKSNFLTDSFGLSEIEIPETGRVKPAIKTEVSNNKTGKIASKKSKNKKTKNGWATFLQYAAVILLVLAVGWFFRQQIIANNQMFELVKERQRSQDLIIQKRLQEAVFEVEKPLKPLVLKVQLNPAFDTLMPNDAMIDSSKVKLKPAITTNSKVPVENANTSVEKQKPTNTNTNTVTNNIEPTVVKTTPKTDVIVTSKSTGKFYIIAGAFKDSGNAIEMVKELKSKGYNAVIVNKDSDVNLVSYGLYHSKQEAETELGKIIVKEPEAWILEK
jgi:cell division septation protein DedD